MIKANINNGFIYGGELETLIDRCRIYHWFDLIGASYQHSVNEIIELLKNIFFLFVKTLKIQKRIFKIY